MSVLISDFVVRKEVDRRSTLHFAPSGWRQCLAHRQVCEWVELFRNGTTGIVDEQRPGSHGQHLPTEMLEKLKN
jgi:hypothetical protein